MLVNYSSSSEEDSDVSHVHHRKRQREDGEDTSPSHRKQKCTEAQSGTGARAVSDFVEESGAGGEARERGSSPAASRLPLPSSLLDMFHDSEEPHVDDRSQHGGRVRSFQHERGNWATYVYLLYEPEDVFLELLDELRAGAEAHGVGLTPAEEFHLTVSKTVVLRHHWIQPFVQSLRVGLAQCRRTFLGMEVSTGCTQLLEAVKRVDETMEQFKLSTFYKDPSFHVSLAWSVGDVTEKLQGACLTELQTLVDGHEEGPFQMRLDCKELRCKTGNKVFLFPLH
ncbi:U6 snRNA phosphodiesterase 1 isoform X2 [Hoplias malabaricus]|uniref:U6 snRNA phosphodiesterase 1 isoform X2 n=1 Tax=Hoplias malabaricus TaxID=27720 RepID=UPI0034636F73